MQQFEFYEASREIRLETKKKSKSYPFEELPEGCSFYVPCDSVNEASFRSLVSGFNSKHTNKLKVLKREVNGQLLLEVANVGSYKLQRDQYICNIVDSSEDAKKIMYNGSDLTTYPFDQLTEGYSFPVYLGSDEKQNKLIENALRSRCTIKGKKLGRKFVVIKHPGCLEVACLIPKGKPKYEICQMSPQAQERSFE